MTERIPENMVVAVVVVVLLLMFFLAKEVAERGVVAMGVVGSQDRSQGRRVRRSRLHHHLFRARIVVIPFGMQYLLA